MENPIVFTDKALNRIEELINSLNINENQFLRVGIKGGGCGGMSFLLAFDEKDEKDNNYIVQGVKIIINKGHIMHVLGLTIDYEDFENNKGFVFISP